MLTEAFCLLQVSDAVIAGSNLGCSVKPYYVMLVWSENIEHTQVNMIWLFLAVTFR